MNGRLGPAKCVIVTPELRGVTRECGGISTFVAHLARLLRGEGDEVTIVVGVAKRTTHEASSAERYAADGIDVRVAVAEREELPVYGFPDGPDFMFRSISEAVERAIPDDADVVYFPDWGGSSLIPLRSGRLSRRSARAVHVTVGHGVSKWVRDGRRRPSHDPLGDTSLGFAERYGVEHSDLLATPSHFYLDWLVAEGVRVPERTRVVGYPFLPAPHHSGGATSTGARFRQLVFFGRQEALKGFDLLLDALRLLRERGSQALVDVERLVFLGEERHDLRWTRDAVEAELAASGVNCAFVGELDSSGAQSWLADNAGDALVVVPSLLENFPYTVLEASLVPGIELLCARVGGIPEILGDVAAELTFVPTPSALADALEERLAAGPGNVELPAYDWRAANARWLELHKEALSLEQPVAARLRAQPYVDVCVPHHNLGRYLPQTLESLAAQTSDRFTVTVVDAGSTDPESLAVFEEMRARYEPRGWRLAARERGGPGWARNVGASLGEAPYVCFVDADDVVAPQLVERLLDAIEACGSDCVTGYAIEFDGDGWPLDADGELQAAPRRLVKPLGGSAASAILYNPYSLPYSVMRRETFERLGGYGDDLYWSDYELYLRLALRGGSFDVVPEYLFYYRWRADSFSRAGVDDDAARLRILQAYAPSLAPLGLELLPELVRGQQQEIDRLRALVPANGGDPASTARALAWQQLASALVVKGARRTRSSAARIRRRLLRNGDPG